MPNSIDVCILAAGKGTRMKSKKPKILHELAGRPMLSHLLETIANLGVTNTFVVIGSGAEQVQERFPTLNFVTQAEQLGTGHAAIQAAPKLTSEKTLILVGDAPLVTEASLERLIQAEGDLVILSADHPNPYNYGRIIRTSGDAGEENVTAIVEHRDATEAELAIQEINTGVIAVKTTCLQRWLSLLTTENAQGEYLLTDLVELAKQEGALIRAVKADSYEEALGVNNFEQLADLERSYQIRQAKRLQAEGVHIVDPTRFTLRGVLTVGQDVFIDVDCIFEGNVRIDDGARIGANVIVQEATIGAETVIKPFSHIEGAQLDRNCSVGPFARLRPGTVFDAEVAVGNFVEVKKTHLGKGSKASHLSYLGDATIGAKVNIGAGTITCNYDGVNKHHTTIEDGVFVGTNTSLVAPVTIGEWSTIAAGSTITSDVTQNALGVARGKQRNIEGWKGPRDK